MSICGRFQRISAARGHEFFNRFERPNSTSRANCGAVERGSSAGKVELSGQRPALQQAKDESGVENVAGARCIRHVYAPGRPVVEVNSVPSKDAFLAQCCCRNLAAKA